MANTKKLVRNFKPSNRGNFIIHVKPIGKLQNDEKVGWEG